mmetsp:Transcript_131350/g.213793  ORF Transcript_131350/g.213793 Transcript_131350/m.213793 type:complete len:108 (+) Transcript_131350:286-609(+)
MVTWRGDVGFHSDFDLYSSPEDALEDKNAWRFCNGNDRNIGFPCECGPRKKVPWQWQSLRHRGGQRNYKWSVHVPAQESKPEHRRLTEASPQNWHIEQPDHSGMVLV